ncbi:biotin--[acetyl-CoA-carboxylase] ligase [Thalassiella azotivora]
MTDVMGAAEAGSRRELDAAALRRLLAGPAGPVTRLDVVASTASTNADLLAVAGDPAWPDLSVLVTDDQRAGRGRLGRTWTTPPGDALAVSVLLRPSPPVACWGWVPLLTGLAVVDALRSVAGVDAGLKWPNDVLVPGPDGAHRKVCGVLAEVAPRGDAVVVGAGVNVRQPAERLPVPTATSLLLAGADQADPPAVLAAVLDRLVRRYRDWCAADGDARASGLHAAVGERCLTLGRPVRVELPGGRPPLLGTAREVDAQGRLVVATAAGPVAVSAGEVVHLRPQER